MEPKTDHTPAEQPTPAETPAPRKRFRIEKIVERIAPMQRFRMEKIEERIALSGTTLYTSGGSGGHYNPHSKWVG